ncbi:MAG: CehA/McbA family metallohydrolase, partial [Planctomycetes bacterium]|nr:CehA/McbA family metallohydrolase [Planctomycetota bacterium]
TSGWISGDFHLHTLTHSGHGDANMKERIISLIGEGVEFAVATDHNHNIDYDPTIRALGATGAISAAVGNEVSTPIGHFNVFPLDPKRPVPDPKARSARRLFKIIRDETNALGVTPVIQLNHPRWGGIDYFGLSGLDPITGTSALDTYSHDFDTLELMNENPGWGYYDADIEAEIATSASEHSVLLDWFNLLNRGHRYAGVGNSDSHTVYNNYAGYPRNFVRSTTDDAGSIQPSEVAAALRERQVFTTLGPFVEFSVNGTAMGGDATAAGGSLDVRIKIQAASWVDCDRVKIVINGDIVKVVDVPESREPVRLETNVTLKIDRDAWLLLLVEGDDSLAPVVHDGSRPIRPIAIANPVWIDADADGKWTSPWEQALAVARVSVGQSDFRAMPASQRGLVVLAAAEVGATQTPDLARAALTDDHRRVRLAAARVAERLADAGFTPLLESAYATAAGDPYLQVALLRALRACSGRNVRDRFFAFVDQHGDAALRKYRSELEPLLAGAYVTQWSVVGYFPNNDKSALTKTDFGPETDDASSSFTGKHAAAVAWMKAEASSRGYLNLQNIDKRKSEYQKAIAYARTYLYSPNDRTVRYALGTDDGCRFYLNGDVLFEDTKQHGADPFGHFGKLELRKGWNRVLIKVENGGGGFGLYFRVFDDEIRSSSTPS